MDLLGIESKSAPESGLDSVGEQRKTLSLYLLGFAQLSIYVWLWKLSEAFAYGRDPTDRPILLVLALFATCFALHLFSLSIAIRLRPTRRLWWLLFAGAASFRIVLLFSEPIQEVDIYRYCWDGAVLRNGVSPFRYSPNRVGLANTAESNLTPELKRLIELRDENAGLQAVLSRVHFAELTTIYPPVSQGVFAATDLVTPKDASLAIRLLVMKSVIVLFDLVTLALMSKMLSLANKHFAWTIAYGWCPLVLKEFANSGHLDSIAVALTLAAILLLALQVHIYGKHQGTVGAVAHHRGANFWLMLGSGGFLAMGVGAKIYPIVLAPIFAAVTFRILGWKRSLLWCITFGFCVTLSMLPMLLEMRWEAPDARPAWMYSQLPANATAPPIPDFTDIDAAPPPIPSETDSGSEEKANEVAEERSPATSKAPTQDVVTNTEESPASTLPEISTEAFELSEVKLPNDEGLVEFLARWEMNDLIFMFIEENLRSKSSMSRAEPWFLVLNKEQRTAVNRSIESLSGWPDYRVAFFSTRVITLGIFTVIALIFAARELQTPMSAHAAISRLGEGCFLTLAWFWLLSPTQNPWYWSWALALLPFARGRSWLFVSGLALIYYLRFWFEYQSAGQEILSSGYVGTDFFDYVVVWFEFAPWFLCLILLFVMRRFRA